MQRLLVVRLRSVLSNKALAVCRWFCRHPPRLSLDEERPCCRAFIFPHIHACFTGVRLENQDGRP